MTHHKTILGGSLALFAGALFIANAPAVAGDHTWTTSGPNPPALSLIGIHALAINPATGKIYAGSGLNNVYSYRDGGLSQSPTARDDSATVNAGASVGIAVLSNDTDPEDALDAASVKIAGAPVHGAASANTDGTVTYTPTTGFTGADSFTYTVADAAGNVSNAAKVVVTVLAAPEDGGDGDSGDTGGSGSSGSNNPPGGSSDGGGGGSFGWLGLCLLGGFGLRWRPTASR